MQPVKKTEKAFVSQAFYRHLICRDAEDFIIVIQKVNKRIPVGIDGFGRASFFIYKEISQEAVKADGKISLFHEDQTPFRTRAGTLRCTFSRCTDRVPLSAAHTAL